MSSARARASAASPVAMRVPIIELVFLRSSALPGRGGAFPGARALESSVLGVSFATFKVGGPRVAPNARDSRMARADTSKAANCGSKLSRHSKCRDRSGHRSQFERLLRVPGLLAPLLCRSLTAKPPRASNLSRFLTILRIAMRLSSTKRSVARSKLIAVRAAATSPPSRKTSATCPTRPHAKSALFSISVSSARSKANEVTPGRSSTRLSSS
mmetsp:Transcript_16264/g.51004  ORF Transcript_16264/g.51004 Transcript_16264/m.51004 type:complete len:213 (-) Transcript_16264:282-920(-)